MLQRGAVCCSELQCALGACVAGIHRNTFPSHTPLCVVMRVAMCVAVFAFQITTLALLSLSEGTHMGWLRLVGSINYRSLLQNVVSFIGLFCKGDL